MSFKIIGAGAALPKFALSNDQISTFVDTSDEWISTRTGIRSRFVITSESLLELAANAAEMALKDANISADEIDLIICTTTGGEFLMPGLGCLVQKEIKAKCPAFDLNVACTGFVYALDVASAYFDSNKVQNILIVSAEIMSNYLDWSDRSTCILFGDGAGAVVLTKGKNLLSIKTRAVGDDKFLTVRGVTGNNPFSKKPKVNPYLQMNGGEIFKFAVNTVHKDVLEVISMANIKLEDVSKIIPHQANFRIIDAARGRLGVAKEKMISAVDKYGNTSSAGIPILINDLKQAGQLVEGEIVVLVAFGAGLTAAACVLVI